MEIFEKEKIVCDNFVNHVIAFIIILSLDYDFLENELKGNNDKKIQKYYETWQCSLDALKFTFERMNFSLSYIRDLIIYINSKICSKYYSIDIDFTGQWFLIESLYNNAILDGDKQNINKLDILKNETIEKFKGIYKTASVLYPEIDFEEISLKPNYQLIKDYKNIILSYDNTLIQRIFDWYLNHTIIK